MSIHVQPTYSYVKSCHSNYAVCKQSARQRKVKWRMVRQENSETERNIWKNWCKNAAVVFKIRTVFHKIGGPLRVTVKCFTSENVAFLLFQPFATPQCLLCFTSSPSSLCRFAYIKITLHSPLCTLWIAVHWLSESRFSFTSLFILSPWAACVVLACF